MSSDTELVNLRNTNEFDVSIGRADSGESHMNNTAVGEDGWLGNPYPESEHGREECIRLFRSDFHERIESDDEFREAVENLRGKTLACWCAPKACHGDVILEWLENDAPDGDSVDETPRVDGDKTPSDEDERGHENPIDVSDVSDAERADMLADYLDLFRDEFESAPKLMPLDEEGKAPIIQGRCRLDSDEARGLLVDGDDAVQQIRDDGARGFAIYAGNEDHGTEAAAFVDHDDDSFPTPTGEPTLVVLSGSGRGDHETYRNDPEDPVANARVGDNDGEIRAKNWYVVTPGSIHPSGGIYHITDERDVATLADNDLEDSMRPASAKSDAETPEHEPDPGADAEEVARENTWIASYLAFGPGPDADRSTKDHAVCWEMVENGVDEENARVLLNDSQHTKVNERGRGYWNDTWKSALKKADIPDEGTAADGGTAAASAAAEAVAGPPAGGDESAGEDDEDDSDPWTEIRQLFATDSREDSKRATNKAARLTAGTRAEDFQNGELDVRAHEESEALYAYDPADGTYHRRGEHRVQEHLSSTEKLDLTYYPSRARNVAATAKTYTYTPEGEFGAPEDRICVANGVLNVSDPSDPTREGHSPEHLFTDGHPVEHDPDAECPEFMEFVEKSVRDEDLKKLQEYAGYCLHTWDQPYKKAMMLVGPQNSGKGTFLRILEAVIGAENTSNETLEDLIESRWAGAQLYDGVANIRNEMSTSKLKHTERFKELTGRGDTMSAERKNEQKFQFTVTQKFLFATNEVPEVNGDDAFNNRWVFAAFPHTVPEPQIDTELASRIIENELSGVLNWMLEGYARLRENGRFSDERGIEEKEEMWEKYGSTVDRFKHACLEVTGDEDDLVRKDDIRPLYKAFCARIAKDPEKKGPFTKELTSDAEIEHGDRTIPGDGSQSDCYIGVTVEPDAFDSLDVASFGPDSDALSGQLSDY